MTHQQITVLVIAALVLACAAAFSITTRAIDRRRHIRRQLRTVRHYRA